MKKPMAKMIITAGLLAGLAVVATGCKPYDKPEFVTIEANQTAFVVPLTGATSDQGKFQSVDLLEKSQVATKRIQITHEWVKTGRNSWWTLWMRETGKWMDNVRVIVVDRTPETRVWSGEGAFVGESKDSIKFNQGISATAQILEEDTAQYLYQYSGKALKDVMDNEIRNKVGSVLLEKYSSLSIDEIRGDKGKIIKAVREEVEPYFKAKGITLSNIGYVDDIAYLNKDIQEAINREFKERQEQKAQAVANQTALDKAENATKVAQEESKAASERQSTMQTQIQLKRLENEAAWIEALQSGKVVLPQTLVQGSDSSTMLSLPAVGPQK